MLPGLRFLFVAIVMATSLLVFGLGATALMRAAHEEFASIPARRAPPEPQFAQQPEVPPVLAMVRVEQPADKAVADIPAPSTAAEPAATAESLTVADRIAAAKTDDPPSAPAPEALAVEPSPAAPQSATDALAAATEATPAAPEPKVAALADPVATAVEPAPAPAKVEPALAPSAETIAAQRRIATLGGPEVLVEAPAAPKAAEVKKPEQRATSKPPHRTTRRRIVRARPARQVVVQQQLLDPFGQPMPITRR